MSSTDVSDEVTKEDFEKFYNKNRTPMIKTLCIPLREEHAIQRKDSVTSLEK
jgi:hypothetical protein